MSKSEDEYLMLREEILHLESIINNTINFFYVFIASFLAFALTQNDTIFLLLSYIVTMPAYLIVLSKMEGMCRIGAYLHVFHEGKEFNWERRNLIYKKDRGRKTFTYLISSNFPFVFVNIAVFVLYLYRTPWDHIKEIYELCKFIYASTMFMTLSILILKNGNISVSDFTQNWEQVCKKVCKY